MTQNPLETRLIERMLLERDLTDERSVPIKLQDGTEIEAHLRTLDPETKRRIKGEWDLKFPVPPVVSIPTPSGPMAKFDLEDKDYHLRLEKWHEGLAREFLAATLGITVDEFSQLEKSFPQDTLMPLFGTVELINGIQSEPLMDLVREALWAPEVLAWVETYKGDPDDLKISDTPLYREMECVVAAGLNLNLWREMSARQKMLYLTWYDAKTFREAYVNWHTVKKTKVQTKDRHIT
jgi:hypothetical protein